MKALGPRLIVEPIRPEVVKNGIYLPADKEDGPKTGIVRSVGPAVKELAVGDKILFDTYAGEPIEVDSEKLIVLLESEVLAVVD